MDGWGVPTIKRLGLEYETDVEVVSGAISPLAPSDTHLALASPDVGTMVIFPSCGRNVCNSVAWFSSCERKRTRHQLFSLGTN